ncbi:MAG: hypothetical protein IPL13_15230 [Saprospiraceae bacterium]|nr:hypothetical protein [Candidatus Brachybacter algidus]
MIRIYLKIKKLFLYIGSKYFLLPIYSCNLGENFTTSKTIVTTILEKITSYFDRYKILTRNDIEDFYYQNEPGLSQSTLNWRIHNLVKNGSLERMGRGKFMVGKNQIFVPAIKNNLKVLNNSVLSIFPFIEICVWSTSLFNEFSKHQSNVVFTMVEVEKPLRNQYFYI